MKLGRSEIATLCLVVLAVASAVLVFATRHAPTTAETSDRANHLLPFFRKDEIAGFLCENGAERVEVERNGDAWTLKSPVKEPADDAAVDRLLDGIGFATLSRRVSAADRATLGFTKPRARLAVAMSGKDYKLALGAVAPAPASGAYVEVEVDGARQAAVVAREVAELLLASPDDFRRHALVGLGPRELSAIELERPEGKLRLVRGQGLAFRLEGNERADRDRVDPLLSSLAGLQATRFLAPAAAEAARGAPPGLIVRLTPRDSGKKAEVLEVGGPCPNQPGETLVITRAPLVRAACLKSETLAALSLERTALVSATPFAARKDEVEGLSLERGKQRLEMTRRGNGFLLRKPSEAEIELEAGNQRLQAILRAPATIVPNAVPKEHGLEPPSGRAVLTIIGDDDKAIEETLELGKVEADGTLYARRKEDGVVLAIAREAARAFQIDSTLLRSRKVLDFALSALTELELDVPERQLLKRATSGFELAEPPGFVHDGELATQAVLALGSLTAERFVADEDDGSFGFEKPTLTAKFQVEAGDAGASERALVVGRPSSGGSFARLTGSPGVFLIERAVVERLSVLLINRGVFLADPATLARLSVATPEKRVTLARRAGELAPTDGDAGDPVAVTHALEALAALRAEVAVHTGPARPNEGFSAPALSVTLEPSAGLGAPRSFRLGKPDSYRGQAVRFARADGVDATFVIAESKLRPLFDLF